MGLRASVTLMGAPEVTSKTKGWGGETLCNFDGGFSYLVLTIFFLKIMKTLYKKNVLFYNFFFQ